jgi:tetrahydromethanopterin S-methyltransferase subunit F
MIFLILGSIGFLCAGFTGVAVGMLISCVLVVMIGD